MHTLVCNGVPEFQPFSMEVQTVGRLAIKGIAYDRAVHTVGMSGMDAQLVGAACFGVVGDAGSYFFFPFGWNIPLAPFVRGILSRCCLPITSG